MWSTNLYQYTLNQRTIGPVSLTCIAHLSAEDMLKSAVISEKKFKKLNLSDLDLNKMTLTVGTHTASCTHLTDCIYQLLYHKTTIVSEKSIVLTFFQYKSMEDQIWPCCKIGHCQPSIIIWINLVVLKHPMLHTNFQGHQPFCFQRRRCFKVFLYMAWRPSWSCDINHLYTRFHSPSHEGFTWNLASISLAVSKEKKLENVESEWHWPKISGLPCPLRFIKLHCIYQLWYHRLQ